MNRLALILLSLTILATGCTSHDRLGAGLEGTATAPPSSAVPADSGPQTAVQTNPSANGGSSLPASEPYQGTGAVSEDVNPAPFLAASQAMASAPANPAPQRKAGRRKK